MNLNLYHKKRNFSQTPEPKGKLGKKEQGLFVLQKHAASHLHYDFRLELQGVLKSWAIPKGPSLDPQIKRLAIQVEDHPVEYGSFEGIIPKGQYGGGTVMLWDKGIWEPLDKRPLDAYQKGHLRFILHAEKLKGRWDLIRFKEDKHWFLIKFKDQYSQDQTDYDVTTDLDKSVISNQSIEKIAKNYKNIWNNGSSITTNSKIKIKKPNNKMPLILPEGLNKSPFPTLIAPQLATLVNQVPKGALWLHEIKLDGYRILAFKNKSQVILKSRNNKEWTDQFPSVVKAIRELPIDKIVLDGEIVLLDSKGRSDFQLLQNSITNQSEAAFKYFIFDILYIHSYDLKPLPLLERKTILSKIITSDSEILYYNDHLINKGQALLEHSCNYELEGIISKRIDSVYLSKRSQNWLKIKCLNRQEFVIGGFTNPQGERDYFGSLFLGVYNPKGELEFAGNVGTGFSKQNLKTIYQQLLKIETQVNPFNSKPPAYSQAHWIKPILVAEVEFSEWTAEGHLRHPSFQGLRMDKNASEVVREKAKTLKGLKKKAIPVKKAKMPFIITHPEKILYPEDRITKEDLLMYYDSISDYILPFIKLRPLTLLRCPEEYQSCFYQRHYNKTTQKALHSIDIPKEGEVEQYIYLNDKKGLLSLVQMGVLEIHPWGSTISHLNEPDILIFDLDPAENVPWSKVVAAALEIRDYLSQYHLQSFVKSTGGKGLHVVIPIKAEQDWDEIKEFTHSFVQTLEKLKPQEYISTMNKSKRTGKIFVDYLRNQRSATAIAAYSTRARIHAPVSTPLAWDELSSRIEDTTYTLKTLPQRLKTLKTDPWADFWKIKQSLDLDDSL